MTSLSVRYRPTEFKEVFGQKSVVRILERQVETGEISHVYLLRGPSGTGKTTLARILGNKIDAEIIEVDGASNNGVDNVRNIIAAGSQRSLSNKYKVFIIDECHMITSAGWNAFLKFLEETPAFTIVILCTTDPQKIPATILNRVMQFNLSKIPTNEIYTRLCEISSKEGFTNYQEACDYIAKISNGGMRDAIASLEKCANYSRDLNIENVMVSLGNCSYDSFFDLTVGILSKDSKLIVKTINDFYDSGKDLKVFIDQYLEFILDTAEYCLFKTMSVTLLPESYKDKLDDITNGAADNAAGFYSKLSNKILKLKSSIKNDSNARATIIITLLNQGEN